jgi:hypothetical protein
MGANAVTTVPVYVAGEVLTAADLNITNSGIPVFESTVERDAAFDGTGEKTLAEGQFAFLEDTNTTQFYDGASWQAVGVAPGLVCVKAETAFTAASIVTADSVFSSAYTNYKIIITGANSTGSTLRYRLRVGGVAAATNYYTRYQYSDAAGVTTAVDASNVSGILGEWNASIDNASFELYGPFVASPTTFFGTTGVNRAVYTDPVIYILAGNHNTSTAYDGIEMFPAAGTMTGSYAIYAYSKTV